MLDMVFCNFILHKAANDKVGAEEVGALVGFPDIFSSVGDEEG